MCLVIIIPIVPLNSTYKLNSNVNLLNGEETSHDKTIIHLMFQVNSSIHQLAGYHNLTDLVLISVSCVTLNIC